MTSASLKMTTDHGEIIHFAGHHHLFPVAKKSDPLSVRLAGKDDVADDELRVGWQIYFRPFIDRDLVFLQDGASGRAVTRGEAKSAKAAPPAGPAGAA